MEYADKRHTMVEDQLMRSGISDKRVIEAFKKVKRHLFIPVSMREEAYMDHPLPIGRGQTISQPYMVALMTELACSGPFGRVLEIGTGSGYQAAILAEIFDDVYTVERDKNLIDSAKIVLTAEGYNNIHYLEADGTKGWMQEAPFDAIVVTAAAPHVPDSIKQQLADGGRLVIPVGTMYSQTLACIDRHGNEFSQKSICGCVFVPLIGEEGWKD